MLFQNSYYFTDNLVFRATLFTYQLVITPITFRPLNNCGCKEWRTIPKIFPVSLMTIFFLLFFFFFFYSSTWHSSFTQNTLFENLYIKISFSSQHWTGQSIEKCVKISVFREYRKNINFTTESVKTKIQQCRAQLDIRPEIITSRQVSQKMFLVWNRPINKI